jgi:hypothetical protein
LAYTHEGLPGQARVPAYPARETRKAYSVSRVWANAGGLDVTRRCWEGNGRRRPRCRIGSNRNSPSSSTNHPTDRSGCMKSNSTATGCMPGWTGAPPGCWSCGKTNRCNTGCWRSANGDGRRLAQGPQKQTWLLSARMGLATERSDHPYPDPNVEKSRRRCHCGNSSTGFIAAPEVASAAARLMSAKS